MTTPYVDYANVIEIARKAGEILLRYYERGDKTLAVENKSDAFDFVTRADKEADTFICAEITKLFPTDRIVSEERVQPDDGQTAGRVWFVDPLDGTKEFMFEGGRFSVMIGLCENSVPVFGVVYDPLAEVVYVGEKGCGSFQKSQGSDWKRLKVSGVNTMSDSIQIIRKLHDEKRDADKLIEKIKDKSTIQDASFGLRLGRIAAGEAEFTINTNRRASKWDTCAPQVILEEAGGKVTDIFGQQLDYSVPGIRWMNSFVASNNLFHPEIVRECKEIAVLWGLVPQEHT
jgi:3'(2'), 5'-bisphosphate nucleotidase